MILGMLEYPGVELPLGVVGLGMESVPKVCSGHRLRMEGSQATGCVGVPESLDLRVPVTSSVAQLLWPPHL